MIAFLLALFLVLIPVNASAQIIPTLESPVEIAVSPSSPEPGSSVLFVAQNVPNSGEISYEWRVDGSLYDQGVGRDRITLTAGDVGDNFSVSLTIYENGSLYGEKTRFIRPAEVDIVWEGDTYTPPFYEGMPLPNRDSDVNLLAVPNIISGGVRVNANRLNYEWYINNSRAPIRKGLGVSSIKTKVPGFGDPFTVSVVVTTEDNLISARKSVSVTPVDPSVLIYEKSPLLGIRFDKAIVNSFPLNEDEATFIAFPINSSPLKQLNYSWRVDGKTAEQTGNSPQELTLRRQGSGHGRFNISFSFESIGGLFEKASKSFLLTF